MIRRSVALVCIATASVLVFQPHVSCPPRRDVSRGAGGTKKRSSTKTSNAFETSTTSNPKMPYTFRSERQVHSPPLEFTEKTYGHREAHRYSSTDGICPSVKTACACTSHHREAPSGVVFTVKPGKREEVRKLPHEKVRGQQQRLHGDQFACGGCPPHQRRHGADNRAYPCVDLRPRLRQRVRPDIQEQVGCTKGSRKWVGARRENSDTSST